MNYRHKNMDQSHKRKVEKKEEKKAGRKEQAT